MHTVWASFLREENEIPGFQTIGIIIPAFCIYDDWNDIHPSLSPCREHGYGGHNQMDTKLGTRKGELPSRRQGSGAPTDFSPISQSNIKTRRERMGWGSSFTSSKQISRFSNLDTFLILRTLKTLFHSRLIHFNILLFPPI